MTEKQKKVLRSGKTLERLISYSLFNAMEKKLPERIVKKAEKAI